MELIKVESFSSYIDIMEKAQAGKLRFSELGDVLSHIAMHFDEYQENAQRDYIVPIGLSEYLAFIDHSVFLDDLEFIEKIAKFQVIFIDMTQLEKIFQYRQEIFTFI